MSNFGYPQLYANGLNNNTQLRRSTDMVYQRGGSYDVVLTGDTYISSMELNVSLYANDSLVGRMNIVPYDVSQSGSTYTYNFNIRPYEYLSNYLEPQPYTYYWLNDWYDTNEQINLDNPYPNSIKVNVAYQYQYLTGSTITGPTGTTDYKHYTMIPECATSTGFTASGFTDTGKYFNYVGGAFQMYEKYYLPNFDQELGTVVGTGITINTIDVNRRLSPMSQFMIDGPSLPEMSETGRFLTEAPRILTIQEDENYVLYFLNGLTGDRQFMEADFAVFEFYDEDNTLLDYFDQEINFSGTTYATPTTGYTDNLQVWSLPCGPKDIDNIFATIAWSGVSYYRVQLFYGYPTDNTGRTINGPIGPSSETFYFYVDGNCNPENTRLMWLNSRGGYDQFTFTTYRQDTKKIERQTFDNRYYSTNLQSPDRDFGRTIKTFDTNVTREIVLDSDYLSEAYAKWIEEVFMSPQVYIVEPDFISPLDRQDKVYKDLRPVQVLSTQVETYNRKHQKLFRYRITLQYGQTYFVNKGF
jgi:hypothetical protein